MSVFVRLNSSARRFDSGLDLLRKPTPRLRCLISLFPARFYVTEIQPEHSDSPPAPKFPKVKRIIKTVDPSKYASLKQNLYDISGGRKIHFSPEGSDPFYFTITRSKGLYPPPPFPNGSKGALYYYRNPSLPSISGEIRFRVFDSLHGDCFAKGYDMHARPERPWALSLLRIVQMPSYAGLLRLLREEKLIDDALIKDIGKLPPGIHDRLNIFRLDQPFLVDLEKYCLTANLVTRAGAWNFRIPNLFTDRTIPPEEDSSGPFVPFKGRSWVRFEVSDLPEHAKRGPCLVLRFLQCTTPLTPSTQNYTGMMIPPQEGELYQRRVSLTSSKAPAVWCYPLQKRKYGDIWKTFIASTKAQSGLD
ncbi:hypothetical protein CPB83DRAFT_853726 [Crepidotus variabilis]|uniref:Uncharacterized protein n=1 Tax=Crepidotus variabilis TaxID=179855 RepID=A0A9P6EGR6_9AGAR|nr:hypothetical protein CPB83DRAFT_853726 [Crepidotus variabilis]